MCVLYMTLERRESKFGGFLDVCISNEITLLCLEFAGRCIRQYSVGICFVNTL
jgi:hypothetical protein